MRTIDTLPTDTTPTEVHPPLSEAAAEAWIPRTCFKNGPPGQIGVELELLVVDARRPDGLAAHYPRHRYPALLRELAEGGLDGRLTVEPGGQVELSSRPGPTLRQTVDTVHRDLTALRRRADRCGARLAGIGVDPLRPPRRTSEHPRYVAMERYLDAWGPAARTMMCSTASVQVNVEAAVDPRLVDPRLVGHRASSTRALSTRAWSIRPLLSRRGRVRPSAARRIMGLAESALWATACRRRVTSRRGGTSCRPSALRWSPRSPILPAAPADRPAGRASGRRPGCGWTPPAPAAP